MFTKFLRARRAPPPAVPAVADGTRIYAIGDIHGCLTQLDQLLALIDADDAARGADAQTQLIFLGDLVDRGPDSAGVVSRLLDLSHARPDTRFLKGNHEEIFLRALEGDAEALRLFCRIGGRETILSYGLDSAEYDGLDYPELAARMEGIVPAAHRDFLTAFEDMVVSGDYAFVHAGVRPGVPLEQQHAAELRWIRSSFLTYRNAHPKMIVHGHTISEEVDRQANRIGVDTGAYSTGRLSALGLEETESWVLNT